MIEKRKDFPKIEDLKFSINLKKYWFVDKDGKVISDYIATKAEGYNAIRSFLRHKQANKKKRDAWYKWIDENIKV